MMKRLFSALLFGAAFALGRAELPLLSPAPVIDGKPGDPGWKNALAASFKVKQGKAFLGRSATHLFVAVEVKHGNLEAAANNFVRHDSAVYADDCLDFFFTGAPGSESYSQIIANVRGTVFDHHRDKDCRTDLTWDSGAEAKGSYGKDSFYIEMAVPLAALGCDRHKLAVAVAAYTSWNQQGEALWGQYHRPETVTLFELPDPFPVRVKERRWAYRGNFQAGQLDSVVIRPSGFRCNSWRCRHPCRFDAQGLPCWRTSFPDANTLASPEKAGSRKYLR